MAVFGEKEPVSCLFYNLWIFHTYNIYNCVIFMTDENLWASPRLQMTPWCKNELFAEM